MHQTDTKKRIIIAEELLKKCCTLPTSISALAWTHNLIWYITITMEFYLL